MKTRKIKIKHIDVRLSPRPAARLAETQEVLDACPEFLDWPGRKAAINYIIRYSPSKWYRRKLKKMRSRHIAGDLIGLIIEQQERVTVDDTDDCGIYFDCKLTKTKEAKK